jgi:uncharacterized membrane protein required for colicin V production
MIDIILALIFLVSILYGLIRGFMSIASPIVALVIAIFLSPVINALLILYANFYKESVIVKVLIFLAVYAIFRILMSKLKESIKHLLKAVYLNWVDSILGAISSLAVSAVIIVMVFSLITEFSGKRFDSAILYYLTDKYMFIIDGINSILYGIFNHAKKDLFF